jgi:branched-chain amino acid transport system permease protein
MSQRGILTLTLVQIGLLIFGFTASWDMIYPIQVLSLAGLVAIQAIGLSLMLGGTGQLSLGQVGFAACGAYGSAMLLKFLHWPFELAFLAGVALAALFGLFVGFTALRLRGQYLAMATLAFGGIVYGLVNELDITGGPMGLLRIPPMSVFGMRLISPQERYLAIWIVAILASTAVLSLMHSRVGRALAAIRDDEVAAGALGINVARYKILVFMISAALSGMSGALYASYLGGIAPAPFDIQASVALLVIVAIGGLGSIPGTTVSAILLTVLPELLRQYETYRPTVYAAALVILILTFPGGLGRIMGVIDDGLTWPLRRLHLARKRARIARLP